MVVPILFRKFIKDLLYRGLLYRVLHNGELCFSGLQQVEHFAYAYIGPRLEADEGLEMFNHFNIG